MHKAVGAALCLLLVATPVLVLLAGIQSDAPVSVWQLHSQRLLEYARRQPGRLADFASGKQRSSFGKVFLDTGSVVATIPEATTHAAGSALIAIKHASIEGLRTALQGMEAAYIKSGDTWGQLQLHAQAGQQKLRQLRLPSSLQIRESVSELTVQGRQALRDFWDWIGPGGRLHPQEFLERFHGHIVIECLLAVVIGYLFIQRSFKGSSKSPKLLSEEEIDDLCQEWQPEPLHSSMPEVTVDYDPPIVTSSTGISITANGKQALNMVSYDFLGAASSSKILESCKATVNKYGVGACGPRGFYGTIDVHLDLEARLARFMGTEEAIIYSYDLSTIPSVLPAFANAKDLLIIDELADYSIQNGAYMSRAKIVWFKHNDVEDLERVMQAAVQEHNRLKKPLNRRFIVVEGLYKATGDLAPLAEITKLKHKYKFRLVVDESLGFGTLGKRGRGACEHFGLQKQDVEIICASMGNALASVGGFCTGVREIVDHQRLSGLGYCFSAALPPYLATAAIGSLDVLEAKGAELVQRIEQNARHLRKSLEALPGVEVVGTEQDLRSPVVHFRLAETSGLPPDDALKKLDSIVAEALKREGVLFAAARVSSLDRVKLPPSIRTVVTAEHSVGDIDKAIAAFQKAAKAVADKRR